MIKTPLSTVIGGAFWTPGATVINGKGIFSVFVKSLFANGEQGFWYDPNDMGTMFQDAAGTVPVTAVGQPVGLIRDKSGRNNHAYQTTSASRPILRQNASTGAYYLEFDGSDDFLVTNNIDFTITDKMSLFAGVRKLNQATTGIVAELSSDPNNVSGSVALVSLTTQVFQIASRGSISSFRQSSVNSSPFSCVITTKSSIGADINTMRVNSLDQGTTSTDQGTGNYGNYPLYIGRRAGTSLPFNGHIYGLIGIGKLTSDSETAAIEKELAKRTGVTLNV
ncbi:hypothetical protein [Acinetobacter indicus]|uniref:hypothetical protein n=1 Tax=Acinetobacter indicus TaxID=756892 RepID=UPI000CEC10D9|nr:hypothetical protein [Acinetobacter indicus]